MVEPGFARQMRATDRPAVSGPLALDQEHCRSHHKRRNGRVVARAKSCLRTYLLNPINDNDTPRDHGAFWLQTSFKATYGWCVTQVNATAYVSSDASLGDSRTPKRVMRPSGRRAVRARVVVDGEGAAPTRGVIKQDLVLYPRVLRRSRASETADGRRQMELIWKGSSRRPLAFVLGSELSFPAEQPPVVTRDLDYTIVKRKSC